MQPAPKPAVSWSFIEVFKRCSEQKVLMKSWEACARNRKLCNLQHTILCSQLEAHAELIPNLINTTVILQQKEQLRICLETLCCIQ